MFASLGASGAVVFSPFSKLFSSPLGSILSGMGSFFSPKHIQNYIDARSYDNSIVFSNYTQGVFEGGIANTMITRSIVFRSFVDANIYDYVSSVYKRYAIDPSVIKIDEWFVMRSIVEKLIQVAYEKKIVNLTDTLLVPGDAFMTDLLKTATLADIETFVGLYGLDVAKMRRELQGQNSYANKIGHSDFVFDKTEGSAFVPYNIAKSELESVGNVQFESSLLHATEDGSSMFKYRTGLEIKRSTLDKAKRFLNAFSDYLSHAGKSATVTLRGGREWGHAFDTYFEKPSGKPIRSKINAAEIATGGKTTKNEILRDSHIYGNCLDLRASGPDGLLLYAFINKHCHTKSGKKSPILMNERMKFTMGDLTFDFMYHGGEPMGGHFHCYFS